MKWKLNSRKRSSNFKSTQRLLDRCTTETMDSTQIINGGNRLKKALWKIGWKQFIELIRATFVIWIASLGAGAWRMSCECDAKKVRHKNILLSSLNQFFHGNSSIPFLKSKIKISKYIWTPSCFPNRFCTYENHHSFAQHIMTIWYYYL